VIGQAKQEQVAGNLWQAWLQQAQAAGGPLATTSPDAAWIGFRQSLHGDQQLSSRPLRSAPVRAAPTAEELTQSLQAKQAAGQSLSEAIKATRAQMDVESSDPQGDRNETLLAEAVLATSGATYLNAYDYNPTAANDPIERASTQIARLDVFDPTILQRAT